MANNVQAGTLCCIEFGMLFSLLFLGIISVKVIKLSVSKIASEGLSEPSVLDVEVLSRSKSVMMSRRLNCSWTSRNAWEHRKTILVRSCVRTLGSTCFGWTILNRTVYCITIERSGISEHAFLWNSVLSCFRWPEFRLYKGYRNQGSMRRILDASVLR